MSFCNLLQQSICPKQITTTWCERCESFQQTLQTRTLKSLPAILTVNCAIETKQVSFEYTYININSFYFLIIYNK